MSRKKNDNAKILCLRLKISLELEISTTLPQKATKWEMLLLNFLEDTVFVKGRPT